MLTREKGVPLYYQLDTILRKMILSGEFEAGALLPTEDLLVQQYQVSRITVRQALAALEKDRLIVRRQGKGTFVADTIMCANLPKLAGKSSDPFNFSAQGSPRIKLKIKVIGFSRVPANKTITDYTGIPEGADIYRIERVYIANQKPLYHMLDYVPANIRGEFNTRMLKNMTLIEIKEIDRKASIKRVIQSVEADIIDSFTGVMLDAREGDPCLILRRVVYYRDDRPIEYLVVTFRADRYMLMDTLLRQKRGNSDLWLLAEATGSGG